MYLCAHSNPCTDTCTTSAFDTLTCTLTDGPTCAYTNNTSACLCCNSVAYRNRQFGAVLDDLQDLVRS
eukprot:m.661671 g.661671  ORF g.661671 m.661671 type:complete len:68 (+) comp22737_c0_seq57:29-232(+)